MQPLGKIWGPETNLGPKIRGDYKSPNISYPRDGAQGDHRTHERDGEDDQQIKTHERETPQEITTIPISLDFL